MLPPRQRRRCRLIVVPLLGLLVVGGCQKKEEIRSYPIAKEQKSEEAQVPAPVAAASPESAEATDRMLGAIVPAGDQTWYFKVVGPMASVDVNAARIEEFFQTIQLPPGAAKPEWKTPDGWDEQGTSGMRAATLMIPADDKKLEMSVIPLPTTGAPGELLANVNRWRGQMQLPATDEKGLEESVRQVKAGDVQISVVDLKGKASAGGMTAPFAGGGPFSGGGRPPFAGGAGQTTPPGAGGATEPELPPGHPPIDGTTPGTKPPVSESRPAPFKFEAPAGWQQQPATGMRKAAFIVKDGDRQADITVIDLPASAPSIADPLQNVNRWRTEIGLAPVTQEQIGDIVKKIEVDGKPSDYAELIPDSAKPEESQAAEATIAAAVPAEGMIWFFKMRGNRDVVAAQRDNFKTFLDSIRFASDGGAGDGNK
jgi:hypothetical protein